MPKGPPKETNQMFISIYASYKSKLMRMVMVEAQSVLVSELQNKKK